MRMRKAIKTLLDRATALTIIILLIIPFAVIAILIKMDSKGKVFFISERTGKDGKVFMVYKFRTMVDNAVNMGMGLEVMEGDPRITNVGSFLRNWSLDEFPQLINVLKGDMSLVGPRPALPHQVEKYSVSERKRLDVRPGITGWAQVNGRNLLSWKEKIGLDIWYVENWSLVLDIRIILLTFPAVFLKKGLYGKDGVVRDY